MTPVKIDEFWTVDDGAPLDPDVYGSGLLSDTIDAYRDRVAELEARLKVYSKLVKDINKAITFETAEEAATSLYGLPLSIVERLIEFI